MAVGGAVIITVMSKTPRIEGQNYRELTALGVLLVLVLGALSGAKFFEPWDRVIYDQLTRWLPYAASEEVIIVAIDEHSLAELGRWPWPRRYHAELLDQLQTAGPNIVGFDMLFSEPAAGDEEFRKAIQSHGNVILPVAPVSSARNDHLRVAESVPYLREFARRSGHADIELDADGVARRVFLYGGLGPVQWPAFALALLQSSRSWQVPAEIAPAADEFGLTQNWHRSHPVLIPYAGPAGTFPRVSYADVLAGRVAENTLRNKTILVGMTATGVGTHFATPTSAHNRKSMSGVELQANIVEMLRSHKWIQTVSPWLAAVATIFASLLTLGLVSVRNRVAAFLLVVGMMAVYLLFTVALLLYARHWLPPSAAIFGIGVIYPIHNWRRVRNFMRSLFAARTHSNAVLDSIGDGVITINLEDRILFMNGTAEKITGVELSSARGQRFHDVVRLQNMSGDDEGGVAEVRVSEALEGERTHYLMHSPSGSERTVRTSLRPLKDEHGRHIGTVIAITDISDTVSLARQVAYHATHDPLTDLANRTLLLERLADMIARAERRKHVLAVLFIDLDGFKHINDTMGHRAGDQLLRTIAGRLNARARQSDVVARWGGDEFVVVIEHLRDEAIVPRILKAMLDAIRMPTEIDGIETTVTASIGVSFYPRNGEDIDSLLERADVAMYRIKREGGDAFRYYSDDLHVWTRDRLILEQQLRRAVQTDSLEVLYHPIVDVAENTVVRVEALLRWTHPEKGLLLPEYFLPLAECSDLINDIGRNVVRECCLAGQMLASLGGPLDIAINVSASQLLQGDFLQMLEGLLRETAFAPERLMLEVTEATAFTDIQRAVNLLGEIKQTGMRIALENFGTGYSSLRLLHDFSFDAIKIDKSLMHQLGETDPDLSLIKVAVALGEIMATEVIATGVESEQQMQLLFDSRCRLQQGFYFGYPVRTDKIAAMARGELLPMPVAARRAVPILVRER